MSSITLNCARSLRILKPADSGKVVILRVSKAILNEEKMKVPQEDLERMVEEVVGRAVKEVVDNTWLKVG